MLSTFSQAVVAVVITRIKGFLKAFHYLSLDVVVGAVASSLLFWKIPNNAEANIPSLAILGICTWIIYIVDRLIDNSKNEPNDARHAFHFRHQYYLKIIIAILILLAIGIVICLPEKVIYFGLSLLLLLIVYFYALDKLSKNIYYQYIKEVFTAILYSLAIVGSAFSTKKNLQLIEYLAGFNFFLLVHQSILFFSFFEKEQNESNNFAKFLGVKHSTYLLFGIFFFIALSNLIDVSIFMRKVFLLETIMSMTSLLIFVFLRNRFEDENYRWLGELVFWLPVLILYVG